MINKITSTKIINNLNDIKKTIIKNNNKKQLNIGLCILRVTICYFVVYSHCCNITNSKYFIRILFSIFRVHVRIFFLMAFYFSCTTIISSDIMKKIQRLKRLVIPYIIWPIILWLLNI